KPLAHRAHRHREPQFHLASRAPGAHEPATRHVRGAAQVARAGKLPGSGDGNRVGLCRLHARILLIPRVDGRPGPEKNANFDRSGVRGTPDLVTTRLECALSMGRYAMRSVMRALLLAALLAGL